MPLDTLRLAINKNIQFFVVGLPTTNAQQASNPQVTNPLCDILQLYCQHNPFGFAAK
jgi:hypothetical protein